MCSLYNGIASHALAPGDGRGGGLPPCPCNELSTSLLNKKHLKNVGPIHHCEPPHAHSADVASGTVARRLRIDVHDNADDNDDNDNA